MEFLELLKRKVNGIVRFQNGRLFNADLERECPAVAVYIDEIEFEPITACNNAFNSIDDISLTAYAYLHDEDQAAWVGARLQYSISYSD